VVGRPVRSRLQQGRRTFTGFIASLPGALLDGKTALCKAVVRTGDALHVASVDHVRDMMAQHGSLRGRIQLIDVPGLEEAACE
jgi:hypothetical protein